MHRFVRKTLVILFTAVLLLGTALPATAAELPKTQVEIAPRQLEAPASPMSVAAFVSAYNANRREGAPEIQAQYQPDMVNVTAAHDKPFSSNIRVNSAGQVTGFDVTVVTVNYGLPDDPAPMYEDMLPSILTAMGVLGVSADAWTALQETEYAQYTTDEYRRYHTGEGFSCYQLLGYADWYPGQRVLITMRLAVDLTQ